MTAIPSDMMEMMQKAMHDNMSRLNESFAETQKQVAAARAKVVQRTSLPKEQSDAVNELVAMLERNPDIIDAVRVHAAGLLKLKIENAQILAQNPELLKEINELLKSKMQPAEPTP